MQHFATQIEKLSLKMTEKIDEDLGSGRRHRATTGLIADAQNEV
jgi:hypothetical protein